MQKIKVLFIGIFLFVFLLTNTPLVSALVVTSGGEIKSESSSVLSDKKLERNDESDDEDEDKVDEKNNDEDKDEEQKIRFEFENELKKEKKIKLEAEDDKIKVEVEDEDEEKENPEMELEEELEIDTGTISGKLKIKGKDGKLFVVRNGVVAGTNFPLSIDLATNELIVTTPAGTKRVTVLPDSAVRNMILRGFITEVEGGGSREEKGKESSSESGELLEANEEVKIITDENGRLVYEIEGVRLEIFLGLFPVRIKKKLFVSAQTGELLQVSQTLIQRIMDVLSFR